MLSLPSVSGVAVSLLVSELTVDILSIFCGVFTFQCVKLTLRTFEFPVLLFAVRLRCLPPKCSLTCLKRFITYGDYAGEVKDVA